MNITPTAALTAYEEHPQDSGLTRFQRRNRAWLEAKAPDWWQKITGWWENKPPETNAQMLTDLPKLLLFGPPLAAIGLVFAAVLTPVWIFLGIRWLLVGGKFWS